MWRRPFAAAAIVVALVRGAVASAQDITIGIIDFYGLHEVTAAQARDALGFKEGDVLSRGEATKALIADAERRLARLPAATGAHVNLVCCDGGRAIVYVGIEERGSPALRFRSAPHGPARLPDDVIRAGEEFETAVMDAVRRGDAEEDDSQGHSLMHDPAARAIQQRFIGFADRDVALLREVVRDSVDPAHRALAAQVLGYASDKRGVADDLAFAIGDPSSSVRNNAMRALAIIAGLAAKSPELGIQVRFEPFVDLLNSPIWTDRNKASFALAELSAGRSAALLAMLRERALPALVEMARWKSDGHAGAAIFTLGRIGGLSEDEIEAAWKRHDREAVIRAATKER